MTMNYERNRARIVAIIVSALLILSLAAPAYGAETGRVSAFAVPDNSANKLTLTYDTRGFEKLGVPNVPTASTVKMLGKGEFGIDENGVQHQWAPTLYTIFNKYDMLGQEIAWGSPDGIGATDAANTVDHTFSSAGEYSIRCDFDLYYKDADGDWVLKRDSANKVVTGIAYRNIKAIPFYYVIFSANGGVPTPEPRFVAENDLVGALPVPPTRVGYVFDGWWTAAIGGAPVTEATLVTAMINCYAHWIANCKVTFDAQGGIPISPVDCQPNQAIGALPTPARIGYTFTGWYTAPIGGENVSIGTVVLQDVTFYARWLANTYTATFNANKGKISKKAKYAVKKTYGDKLGKLKTPTRKGYKFRGWYTKKSGGQKISKNTLMPGENVTYYAQWKKK